MVEVIENSCSSDTEANEAIILLVIQRVLNAIGLEACQTLKQGQEMLKEFVRVNKWPRARMDEILNQAIEFVHE